MLTIEPKIMSKKQEEDIQKNAGEETDEETDESEEKDEETDSEEEKDDKKSEDSDEKVEISKSELDKLSKKAKDFDGLTLRLKKKKRKGRVLPGSEQEAKEKKSSKEDDDSEDTDDEDDSEKAQKGDFVTKKEFQKQIDDDAISEASEDPIIDEHYDEILEYLTFRPGERNSVKGTVAALKRAAKAWKADNLDDTKDDAKEEDDEDKTSKSDLAKDSGTSKGKDKETKPAKKSIIPKKEKMSDWYGDKKKK